ncbi:MAG TPA: hypothetical protein VKZ18_10295, partial [Polyangia bacterium]|nr:hypothetical protein [Polyangia bacterium]
VSKAVADIRGNARAIVAAVAQQVKTASVVAVDVGALAAGIGRIRVANERQADAVEMVTSALTALQARDGEPARATETA